MSFRNGAPTTDGNQGAAEIGEGVILIGPHERASGPEHLRADALLEKRAVKILGSGPLYIISQAILCTILGAAIHLDCTGNSVFLGCAVHSLKNDMWLWAFVCIASSRQTIFTMLAEQTAFPWAHGPIFLTTLGIKLPSG